MKRTLTPARPRAAGLNVRLLVLGTLSRKAMHGYDIQRLAEQSQTAQWAQVLPGSIYHALKSLESEGLLAGQGTEATGKRPREVFGVTPKGRKVYLETLREAWRRVPDSMPSSFYVALTFWEDLPPEEALAALDHLLTQLRAKRDAWNDGEAAKSAAIPLPEALMALFQNGRDHLQADIALLERLRRLAAARK